MHGKQNITKQHSLVPGPQNDDGHAVIMLFINTHAYVLCYILQLKNSGM